MQPGVEDVCVADSNVPAKVVIEGLEPGTEYRYRACHGNCLSSEAWGKFRMPHADGYHGLRFGVSSCWSQDLRPFVSIKNVPARDLDFFVALGDTVYADGDGSQAETRSEFRKKHRDAYSHRFIPDDNMFALARASTAVYVNIDDHEVTDDFAGGARPELHRGNPKCTEILEEEGHTTGLLFDRCMSICNPDKDVNPHEVDDPDYDPNWIPNCNRQYVNETDLYKNAIQALHEYNPIRDDEEYGDTNDDRTAKKKKLYRHRTFGSDAALFMLDARSFRDRGSSDVYDTTRTMLGKAQLDELLEDLREAEDDEITWKLVLVPEPIQYLPLDPISAYQDRFEGYAHERGVLLDFIEDEGISNVVFISGDIHGTIVNDLTYETYRGERQRYSAAWDISTGPVAYSPPFGPGKVTLKRPPQWATREKLDERALRRMQFLLWLTRRPGIGLGHEDLIIRPKQRWNEYVPVATLHANASSYLAVHTYGWTEFEIAEGNQKLTVTTYGTDWYEPPSKTDPTGEILEAYEESVLPKALDASAKHIEIVSQFSVEPELCKRDNGLAEGQSCSEDSQCRSCVCRLADDTCTPPGGLRIGESCARDRECESGVCNDWSDTCEDPGETGHRCREDGDCASAICALAGLNECAREGGLLGGMRCTRDQECESLNCNLGGGPFSRCLPLQGGQACLVDSQCQEGEACEFSGLIPRCTPFPDDYRCHNSGQCVQDSYCNDNWCSPEDGPGAPCTQNSECLGDLVCNDVGASRSTCESPGGNRDRCTEDDECDEGPDPDYPDLVCNTAGVNRCRPPGEKGGFCWRDEECESGICSLAGKNECTGKGGLNGGARCTRDDECKSSLCMLPDVWGGGLVAQCWPLGGGDVCLYDAQCQLEETCQFSGLIPRCTPFPDDYRCASDGQCAEGSVCNDVGIKMCEPLGTAGDRCKEDDDCGLELVCNTGLVVNKCTLPGGEGDRCFRDEECDAGPDPDDPDLVCNNVGANSCEPPRGRDERCTENNECKGQNLVCKRVGGLLKWCVPKNCTENGESCTSDGNCCSNSCRNRLFGGPVCRVL
jgi:3-phytase/alkaline phosphatase D